MKRIDLIPVAHACKMGDECPPIAPNVHDDCMFYIDGKPIGFFLQRMPEKLCKLADVANAELQSDRVPKTLMERVKVLGTDENGKTIYDRRAKQFSAILGGIPPKPHMRRPYASMSSVHSHKSARTFVKAMLLLALESERVIKEIMPEQYETQAEIFKSVLPKWKFGNLFTSSISNFNISAPFHRDAGNFEGTVNVIITKRKNSYGGNLYVPDYNATIDQCDNSMLVYPAWRNMHAVTPIVPTAEGGYRNSLVFYPLKAFKDLR